MRVCTQIYIHTYAHTHTHHRGDGRSTYGKEAVYALKVPNLQPNTTYFLCASPFKEGYAHTYALKHLFTHTHIHTHIHTHTHTCRGDKRALYHVRAYSATPVNALERVKPTIFSCAGEWTPQNANGRLKRGRRNIDEYLGNPTFRVMVAPKEGEKKSAINILVNFHTHNEGMHNYKINVALLCNDDDHAECDYVAEGFSVVTDTGVDEKQGAWAQCSVV
jgi:hypothetical protein